MSDRESPSYEIVELLRDAGGSACAARGRRRPPARAGVRQQHSLVGFAVLLMALALTLTMSRSGMLGLLAALVISGWFVARRQATGSRRALVAGYLIFVALVAAGWTGFDRIAARFTESGAAEVGGRLGIWGDTWRLAGRFPIVGTGLNTYGAATLFYQTVDLEQQFAEAHNDYLQLLAEG